MYRVTRLFVSGLLKGLTYTETTSVKFVVGKRYKGLLGTSDFKIVSVEEVK